MTTGTYSGEVKMISLLYISILYRLFLQSPSPLNKLFRSFRVSVDNQIFREFRLFQ